MSNEKVVEAKKPGIWPSWPRVPAWCWGITIFNWLVWLFGAFDWTVVLVLGPVIIDEWSLSAPTWTLMLAFFYWVRGAFAVPGAAISDKLVLVIRGGIPGALPRSLILFYLYLPRLNLLA